MKSCYHLSSLRLWSSAVGVFFTAVFAGMSPSTSVCTPALTGQVPYWASPALGCVREHEREGALSRCSEPQLAQWKHVGQMSGFRESHRNCRAKGSDGQLSMDSMAPSPPQGRGLKGRLSTPQHSPSCAWGGGSHSCRTP